MKFLACGDYVNHNSCNQLLSDSFSKKVSECDFALCNFEAPVAGVGVEINKAGPHVSQPKSAITHLAAAGFNLVTVANNHIFDYGCDGLSETLMRLDRAGLASVGAGEDFESAYQAYRFSRGGVEVAVISVCEAEFGCLTEDIGSAGYAWIDHYLVDDLVSELSQQVDILILCAHVGVEEVDIPLPEWRSRFRRLCDLGVDVIIGHHPHVPQGFERYGSSLIFYSLGNFYFDSGDFSKMSDDSFSVMLNLEKDGVQDFELLYHRKSAGQVHLVEPKEVAFDIDYLNMCLLDGYNQRVDELVARLYKERYKPYYDKAAIAVSFDRPLLSLSRLLKDVLCFYSNDRQRRRDLLLLHNIRIESHRYVVQRALSSIGEKGG